MIEESDSGARLMPREDVSYSQMIPRTVFYDYLNGANTVQVVVCGGINTEVLEALEDFVARQKRRIALSEAQASPITTIENGNE